MNNLGRLSLLPLVGLIFAVVLWAADMSAYYEHARLYDKSRWESMEYACRKISPWYSIMVVAFTFLILVLIEQGAR